MVYHMIYTTLFLLFPGQCLNFLIVIVWIFTSSLIKFSLACGLDVQSLTYTLLPLFRPTHWVGFIQRLELLGANSSALRNSKLLTAKDLLQLITDSGGSIVRESETSSLRKFHSVMDSGSLVSSSGSCQGASCSALWLPLDLALEDAMDGYQVNATSAIEIITGRARVEIFLKPM